MPIALLIGILVGLIGLIFSKTILVVVTSAFGGVLCGSGVYLSSAEKGISLPIAVGIAVMLSGSIYQFYVIQKKILLKDIKTFIKSL